MKETPFSFRLWSMKSDRIRKEGESSKLKAERELNSRWFLYPVHPVDPVSIPSLRVLGVFA
jgi:hypothetical protein